MRLCDHEIDRGNLRFPSRGGVGTTPLRLKIVTTYPTIVKDWAKVTAFYDSEEDLEEEKDGATL